MCDQHEFVLPDNLDEELQEMLNNQSEAWNELKVKLEEIKIVNSNTPPPECASEYFF